MFHVIGDVNSENVFPVDFGVELFRLVVVAGKPLGRVGNVDATVHRSFHGAENSGASGGAGKAGIEAGSESSGSVGGIFDHEVVAINLGLTLVQAVKVKLLEDLLRNDI